MKVKLFLIVWVLSLVSCKSASIVQREKINKKKETVNLLKDRKLNQNSILSQNALWFKNQKLNYIVYDTDKGLLKGTGKPPILLEATIQIKDTIRYNDEHKERISEVINEEQNGEIKESSFNEESEKIKKNSKSVIEQITTLLKYFIAVFIIVLIIRFYKNK